MANLIAPVKLAGVLMLACSALAAKAQPGLPEFTGLVEKYSPAVVNISTVQVRRTAHSLRNFSMPNLPEDSPLYDWLRRFLGEEEGGDLPDDDSQGRSLGSGLIFSSDGYILTNYHVVDGADEVIVRTNDRREYKSEVIGKDKRSDIALLKIEATGLPTVKIGTSKDLKVGEWVLAIGSPFGFDYSATAGIVSAKGRSLPSENYVPFIQTDVAINPGNSGGPLFNLDGDVVGVNSQIFSRTGGFMGLSFAIPIEVAMDVAQQLRAKGRVTRGWLGVLIQDVTRDLAETFGMPQPKGALVAQVLPNSPAEKAGLRPGDIVLSFNGKELPTSGTLPPLVGISPVDQAATVEVLRSGKPEKIQVIIGELPEEEGAMPAMGKPSIEKPNRLGVTVRELTGDQRKSLEIERDGVLVDDVAAGAARDAGIRSGDVILMLNNQMVKSTEQFRDLVKELPAGRSVAVLLQRGSGRMFLALRVPQ
jgi:serine protease Do